MDLLIKQSGEADIDITKEFYAEFKTVRKILFEHIVNNNPITVFPPEHWVMTQCCNDTNYKLLLEKTQKLLDRFIFIFFCEDTAGLLPHNTVENIYKMAQNSFSLSECKIWEQFRGLFVAIDKGNNNVNPPINAYNGGLFAYDEILDKLIIKDEMFTHIKELARYDFESDLNVNILGHIFEQSLSDLEQIKNELDGIQEDKKNSKRKKDGIFYTPEYITHYIVEETIGKYLEENPDKLETIKILDPACGSGAFLNQAHSFLLKQRQIRVEEKINAEKSHKRGGTEYVQTDLFKHTNQAEHDRSILLNNLFGVDLNKESVEITKLALWLKTANSKCKLNNLDENIKCGNSLIDDETIAGDKAFKWETEFPQIFRQKELKAYHITFRLYGSYKYDDFEKHKEEKFEIPNLSQSDEEFILNEIAEIAKNSELRLLALNICKNHVHMAVICEYEEVEKYVQKIKSVSSRAYNIHKGITIANKEETISKQKSEKTQNRLWASKYDVSEIETEEELSNVIAYIQNNRIKHNLPELNEELKHRVMTQCYGVDQPGVMTPGCEKAFSPQYKGGFDVIIGNPPYVQIYKDKDYYKENYFTGNCGDLYAIFIEKSIRLLKNNGIFAFIVPSLFLKAPNYENLRNYISQNTKIIEIKEWGDSVFQDVKMPTCTIILQKTVIENQKFDEFIIDNSILNKIESSFPILSDISKIQRGLEIGKDKFIQKDNNTKKIITGENIERYNIKNISYIENQTYYDYKKDNYFSSGNRILIRETGARLTCVFLNDNEIQNTRSLYSIKLNNEKDNYYYIIALLNSALLQYYYSNKFKSNTNIFPKIRIIQVKQLPIPNATEEQQNSLAQKAERMIELNKSLQEETQKAIELIELEYKPKKISQKLEKFYEIGLNPFMEELNKLGVMTPSSKLTLAQKEDLISWYKTKSDQLNKIKSEIDTLDRKIDQEVYKLYNLTPEEIQIIEGQSK